MPHTAHCASQNHLSLWADGKRRSGTKKGASRKAREGHKGTRQDADGICYINSDDDDSDPDCDVCIEEKDCIDEETARSRWPRAYAQCKRNHSVQHYTAVRVGGTQYCIGDNVLIKVSRVYSDNSTY